MRPDLDLDVVRGKQTAPLKRNKKAPHYMCLSVVVASHDVGADRPSIPCLQVASLEREGRAGRRPRGRRGPRRPARPRERGGVDAAVGRRREGPGGFEKGAPAEHPRRGRLVTNTRGLSGHADDRTDWDDGERPGHKSMRMRTSRASTFQ